MTAGWVAPVTRGRALVRRLVGPDAARELATSESWPEARRQLTTTFYGADVGREADRATARAEAAHAGCWQLRVLAGWCPPGAAALVRVFGAPFEITNIEHHIARIEDRDESRPIPLGSLGVAWPHVATTATRDQVRAVLTHSPWGDPGGTDPSVIGVGLRVAWARRLTRQVPQATEWAHGSLAVLVARERFGFDREIAELTSREVDRAFGHAWRAATTINDFVDRVPKSAGWPLAAVDVPADLWKAELSLVRRAAVDANRLAKRPRYDQVSAAGIMASLLVDLWQVTAAIAVAGCQPTPMEMFDVVA